MAALDSLYFRNAAEWAVLYDAVFAELGNTATICNFGDQRNAGLVTAATFTGRQFNASGLAPVWTPTTAALSAWATPFDLKLESNWRGYIPILTADNTTPNYIQTPDVDFFSRVEPAVFSVGLWLMPSGLQGTHVFSKGLGGGGSTTDEWSVEFVSAVPTLRLRDPSVGAGTFCLIGAAGALPYNRLSFVVFTYNGAGGATAMNAGNAEVYLDGVIEGSPTRTNDANYVAMENGTRLPTIGNRSGGGAPFVGWLLGGPLGPFFCQATLTAANVKNLYDIGRLALGI